MKKLLYFVLGLLVVPVFTSFFYVVNEVRLYLRGRV